MFKIPPKLLIFGGVWRILMFNSAKVAVFLVVFGGFYYVIPPKLRFFFTNCLWLEFCDFSAEFGWNFVIIRLNLVGIL